MKERKLYEVTDRAGPWVAGQRRPVDGRLWLTDSQAAYELRLGTIRPYVPPAPPRRGRKPNAKG
ncbi:hypothetical protein [Chelatococcus sp. XZ-Ab1]|uniref:hypothetical protein n=1 Tax=Chelatococcus sp. XZ-Ab1 TaxID=3034027 RepID=UPI0023E354C7|nr:hypothetical protein [Chelatococcus sp. XZ-Ab1]